MQRFVLLLILVSSTLCSFSQDRSYAESILDKLCSADFHGRGYYLKGDSIAADYLAAEFSAIGLNPFESLNEEAQNHSQKYYQNFRHSVNAINGKLEAKFNESTLIAGKDYLVDPSSPTYEGMGEILVLTKKQLTSVNRFMKSIGDFKDKFLVIDPLLLDGESKEIKEEYKKIKGFLTYSNDLQVEGIIELAEKLTFTASPYTAPRPHLSLLRSAYEAAEPTSKGSKRTLHLKVESEFTPDYLSRNVVGFIEGEHKDSFVCVIAHYDHLGRMGHDVYFPGANDNASGVAMMMSLAREFSISKPTYTMVFIAFGAEEIGLVGSQFFVQHSPFPLSQIKFLINLDILGTGEEGIQVVNGKVHEHQFDRLSSLNNNADSQDNQTPLLTQVKTRGAACNSDHCFFHEADVPSFFIYTLGGVAHYHDIYDRAETLPLTEFEDLFTLLVRFIHGL